MDYNMLIHLIAGGLAGTAGTVLTCPLEVIKTRLQANLVDYTPTTTPVNNTLFNKRPRFSIGLILQFRSIIQNEGYKALFKGLVPNMIGVAPYRAIYFFSYANSKLLFLNIFKEEKPILHVCSAIVAGFTAVTITNPIWFVKTRMQLDQSKTGITAYSVTKSILNERGIAGFYKGITASYFGISETVIYFVVYEQLKRLSSEIQLSTNGQRLPSNGQQQLPFFSYITSAGLSKTMASIICYPHEVARTRLRQVGDKYNGFFQTLGLIVREEGLSALYKGLATHLIKQIPNTVIIMTTYELTVNYFHNCQQEQEQEHHGTTTT